MGFSTQFSIASEHLALYTQRGLFSKWSTPQPHAMPTSSPSCTSNGEMDAHCGLPVASSICLWMTEDEFSQMDHSPRPTGGRGNEVSKKLSEVRQSQSLTPSITSSEGQTKERGEARESADSAFVSVWIMMGEWVTEWQHRFASLFALFKNKMFLL